jgi:hypothetical protein
MPSELADWFCLKEGRENFSIIPDRDHQFMFGNSRWREDIRRELERSLRLNQPIRIVWWGDYGIGKTQRLRYTEHFINTTLGDRPRSFLPVVVMTRDLQDKSGFEQLHYELVNRLRFSVMRDAAKSYVRKLLMQVPGILPFEQLSTSEDVINAFNVLGGANDRFAETAWRFLAGLEIGDGMQAANVNKKRLDSSIEFAAVLATFSAIIQVEQNKQLFYMVDQVETLSKITNKNAEARWVETLRAVLDVPNLSLALAIGGSRLDGLPTIVLAPEIVRRFTVDKYIQMGAYETQDAEAFVRDLLANLIEPGRRDSRAVELDLANRFPGYDPATYPFTTRSFAKFCRYFGEQPKIGKPSEIIPKLNSLADEAFLREEPLLTEELLVEHGINA